MARRTKAAIRKQRYRERLRQRTMPQADIEARIADIRGLIKQDTPLDLLADYARIGILLDEELAGRRRTRAIQELSAAKLRLAEELGITPKQKRLSGERPEDLISQALARSVENGRRAVREAAAAEADDDARFNKPIADPAPKPN